METQQVKILFKLLLSLIISLIFIINCSGGDMKRTESDYIKLEDIPATAWKELGGKKIFFAHQSVGNNIINGIKDIIKENPTLYLNIMEISEPVELEEGVFAHTTNIGKNEDPQSKIDAFASYMENGIGNNADLAFLKFCFVDVDNKTDIQNLFTAYKNEMAKLKNKYPETTIIHFTVPLLKKNKPSFKNWIKGLFGKNDGFFANEHNIKRNKFNDLIVKEYIGIEPVFDLAETESTYPDGSRETFIENGEKHYSLVPAHTDDGGHLNETGRKKIAEQFLLFLINLDKQKF